MSIVIASEGQRALLQNMSEVENPACHLRFVGLLNDMPPPFNAEVNRDAVLVEKIAFSCNFRDKVVIDRLNEAFRKDPSDGKYTYFGSDFVARVVKVGSNVTSFSRGHHVIPCAHYVSLNSGGVPSNFASRRFEVFHERALLQIPEQVDPIKAAAFSIGAQTARSMIRKLNIRENANVLVTGGSSNTSLAVLQILKRAKANVYVISGKEASRFHSFGIRRLFPDVRYIEGAMKDISGFDYVIDPFSDIYFPKLARYLNLNAIYITCGIFDQLPQGPSKDSPSFQRLLPFLIARNITIIGSCLGERSDLAETLDDFITNQYDVVIDSVFGPADDLGEFFSRTFYEKNRFGKVVFTYEPRQL